MIGRLAIDEPVWDERLPRFIALHQEATGQGHNAIGRFGLAGAAAQAPEWRLYSAYQHLKANPDDGPAWLALAGLHAELRQFAPAEAILRELQRAGDLGLFSELYQEDVAVHLAHLLAATGRIGAARSALLALASRHGGLPIYEYVVGSLYHAEHRYEEAMAHYRTAIEILREQRAEVEEELDVDAILDVMLAQRIRAEAGEAFDGNRPVEMGGLLEQLGE